MRCLLVLLLTCALPVQALTLVTEDYPPMNFTRDGGQSITGLSTEVMREILQRTGIAATFSIHPWRMAYRMALENEDTCVYTTVRTEAREALFKWVGPLAAAHWTLYALADSPIRAKTLADLKPYIVGGYQHDAKSIYMQSLGFRVDEANTEQQSLKKLQSGRIDLWVASTNSGPWSARALDIKIRPIYTLKEVNGYAACNLAVPDLVIERMNAALKGMQRDGSYERLTAPYK